MTTSSNWQATTTGTVSGVRCSLLAMSTRPFKVNVRSCAWQECVMVYAETFVYPTSIHLQVGCSITFIVAIFTNANMLSWGCTHDGAQRHTESAT
jgi:hypothetical protein